MITGKQDRTVKRRAFEAGVEFFLFKPVERNKLLCLIRVKEGPIERGKAALHAGFTCAAETGWNQAVIALKGQHWASDLAGR